MAAFNYSGFATITWEDKTTVQYVHYEASDSHIYVWPENSKSEDAYEYSGHIADYPAENIEFRH